MKISLIKKAKGLYCCAYGCTNKPGKKTGGLCPKHKARKAKLDDKVAYRYNIWKQKSKQRGIVNTVTLEQFRSFCNRTGYLIVKYRCGRNATIDRRCSIHGYHIWNMQLLSHRANAVKQNKVGEDFDCPF